MKEQFIPYELALELKELGFDEPCIAEYTEYSLFRIVYQEADPFDERDHKFKVFTNTSPNYYRDNPTSAPLWQQAFEFCLKKLEGYTLEYDSDWDGHVQKPCGDGFSFRSKDECLEGLIELIKDRI